MCWRQHKRTAWIGTGYRGYDGRREQRCAAAPVTDNKRAVILSRSSRRLCRVRMTFFAARLFKLRRDHYNGQWPRTPGVSRAVVRPPQAACCSNLQLEIELHLPPTSAGRTDCKPSHCQIIWLSHALTKCHTAPSGRKKRESRDGLHPSCAKLSSNDSFRIRLQQEALNFIW